MSYNKENKPDSFASQENDPAMANIDLSRLDSSGFIKVLGNSTKGQRSRTSSRSSSIRGNSPPQKKDPLVHKSVIQEKANIPPPKDWDEPTVPAEIKDLSTSDMPINEESVVKYESQFPALGESTETLAKSEMVEFTPEILNPQTIVQTSILKEATDTSSAAANPEDLGIQESKSISMDQSQEKHEHLNEFADGWTKDGVPPVQEHVDIQVPEEKAEEYTSHFPALGAEPEEVHPETEFTPEILEAETQYAPESTETPQVEKLQIPIENIPVERMKEEPGDRTPKNSETDEIQQFEAFMRLPLEQIPSGVGHGFASGRSPSHQDLAKKGLPDEVPATFSGTLEALEAGLVEANVLRDIGNSTNIPLDEIPGGIAKGFASGRSPSHKDLAKKNLPDDVPATFSGTIESLGPQVMGTNIPLNRIPGGIAKGYASGRSPSHKELAEKHIPDEVPATFSDTVDTLKSNIPLDKIVGGMAKGFGNGKSPSHKDLAAKNIPDEVPATFSGTVEELEYEYMLSSLPLDKIPSDIAMGLQDTPDPTHFQLVRMGIFDDVPATFSEAFEVFRKSESGQTILEQKLESELEQEDQALDNLLGGVQQRFIGKYQRIKQDRELEKTDDNLLKSWEVIKTDLRTDKGEENRDHSGYKPARLGEEEEAEGLLDEEEKVVAEEEAFGNYKSSAKKNNVEIKDETPLQPVEENIVIPPENQTEGINMQDLIKPELKEIEKTEFSDREKPSGEKSSLEHIAESSELENRSTEMTLSSQRIDLIKEELKEVIDQSSRDPIFHEVEKNLHRVKELEKSRMYGAAINLLKKNLEILDARIARHDMTFNVREMNSLLINCNAELAQCYHQVIDYRHSMQYARAALNLDSKNTQAIYYLGAAQNKTGDFLGGYNTLKEIKRLGLPADHDDYLILIESEILKFEKKVEDGARKAEMGMISPGFKDLPKATRTPMEDKQDSASLALSNIGVFVGTSSLAGAASWMLSKNHFKLSEKKTFMYSVGIGALIGTASLALLGHFRKTGNNKK